MLECCVCGRELDIDSVVSICGHDMCECCAEEGYNSYDIDIKYDQWRDEQINKLYGGII